MTSPCFSSNQKIISLVITCLLLLSGCKQTPAVRTQSPTPSLQIKSDPEQSISPTIAPEQFTYAFDADLPLDFETKVTLSSNFSHDETNNPNILFTMNCDGKVISNWIYVLVAPFTTIRDNYSVDEFSAFLHQSIPPVVASSETKRVLTANNSVLGNINLVVGSQTSIGDSISMNGDWAIVPFDQLTPEWKVIKIDAISPLDKNFDPATYFLSRPICVTGDEKAIKALESSLASGSSQVPISNRESGNLIFLLMTGTTALTRDIARKMDQNGVDYPAEKILPWFQSADLVHISNEISFKEDCNLNDRLLFCSKPDYLKLLQKIGANIIELTGNHLNDFGSVQLENTLNVYDQNGMSYYGGGKDLADARKPLLIEKNGNKLAFLGCNAVGPDFDLATSTSAGANPCDRNWMKAQIDELSAQDYNVIVTYQDLEGCDPVPPPAQRGNFIFAAESGAVIVSGSQAHCPQAMEFRNGAFIHYGLGNLFFDQMEELSRKEFLDRYTFYNNRLISIELLTAELEDSSQPRPMTEIEREALLGRIFTASGWSK